MATPRIPALYTENFSYLTLIVHVYKVLTPSALFLMIAGYKPGTPYCKTLSRAYLT